MKQRKSQFSVKKTQGLIKKIYSKDIWGIKNVHWDLLNSTKPQWIFSYTGSLLDLFSVQDVKYFLVTFLPFKIGISVMTTEALGMLSNVVTLGAKLRRGR